jgi:hypothetical protein
MIETQNALLRQHFEEGRTITGLEALRLYGVSHLPRRILDIKEGGYPLANRWVRVQKANGDVARVKEWRKGSEA